MVKTARALDLEPIERLEDRIKTLVDVVEKLRSEYQQTREENARLKVEIEGLQSRVADAEHVDAELVALRDERDQIRARVETILGQLEALDV